MWTIDLTADEALFLVERLVAFGIAITNAELLISRSSFATGGILALSTLRLREEYVGRFSAAIARAVMAYPFVLLLVTVRLLSALVVLGFPGGRPVAVFAEGLIVLVNIVFAWVRLPGGDGSDQMLSVSSAAVFLARALDDTVTGLWFLTAQSCLAYAAAGVAKLISRTWRDGTALQGVMRTASYGTQTLHRFLSTRYTLCLLLSWGIIGFECCFPLVLVLPRPAVYAFLVGGGILHVSIAVSMRLNVFVWAFIAPYPAVAFWAQRTP